MLTARRETKRRMEALRRVPFFADCTLDELARIDRLGTTINVRQGRTLTREGAVGRECFVTLDGIAVAQRRGRPIGVIGAGSIAGEMALLSHTTRNATVVADTPMRVLVLDQREFAELLAIAPHIETAVERIADERRTVPSVTPPAPAVPDLNAHARGRLGHPFAQAHQRRSHAMQGGLWT
jgi:hypothetical protein